MSEKNRLQLTVTTTRQNCPIGETVGNQNRARGTTPVLSCEGACIRGEIARQAANMVARQPGFGRGCHGEMLTVPHSAIAQWIDQAERVVLIDGCFLKCHGRVLEHLLDPDKLVWFDALSHYKKYTEIFDPEEVPYDERQAVARDVADWVLARLAGGTEAGQERPCEEKCSGCCG